jgi:two-component system, NarL family, nitrate/nitrite response regulator NarL
MHEGRVRVLLADHRRMIRIALGAALANNAEFVAVAQTQTGREALAALPKVQPDLVVCAADLPGLTAIETCSQIKERSPDTRTIVLAGVADSLLIEQAVLAGVDGIATGDASVDDFIDVMRRVMDGETVVPPSHVPMLLQRLSKRRHESDALMHRFVQLTRREREVLQLVVDGHNYRAIARALYISPQTARRHIHNMLSKLDMHSCVEAAARCVAEGLVSASPDMSEKAV